MSAAVALNLYSNVQPGDQFNTSVALDEEPEVCIYASTAESNHKLYAHVGSYPASDEMFWLKQHERQAGESGKVLVLPFYEGKMVDAGGNAV